MKKEIIENFIKISSDVIVESTGFTIKAVTILEKPSTFVCNDVVIVLGISGNVRGQVIFSMPEKTAIKVASRIIEEIPIDSMDEIARCAIAEFGNIVLGRSVNVFEKTSDSICGYTDITPPAIATGKELKLHIDNHLKIIGINYLFEDISEPLEINISICESQNK